jgi:hypothetical protein
MLAAIRLMIFVYLLFGIGNSSKSKDKDIDFVPPLIQESFFSRKDTLEYREALNKISSIFAASSDVFQSVGLMHSDSFEGNRQLPTAYSSCSLKREEIDASSTLSPSSSSSSSVGIIDSKVSSVDASVLHSLIADLSNCAPILPARVTAMKKNTNTNEENNNDKYIYIDDENEDDYIKEETRWVDSDINNDKNSKGNSESWSFLADPLDISATTLSTDLLKRILLLNVLNNEAVKENAAIIKSMMMFNGKNNKTDISTSSEKARLLENKQTLKNSPSIDDGRLNMISDKNSNIDECTPEINFASSFLAYLSMLEARGEGNDGIGGKMNPSTLSTEFDQLLKLSDYILPTSHSKEKVGNEKVDTHSLNSKGTIASSTTSPTPTFFNKKEKEVKEIKTLPSRASLPKWRKTVSLNEQANSKESFTSHNDFHNSTLISVERLGPLQSSLVMFCVVFLGGLLVFCIVYGWPAALGARKSSSSSSLVHNSKETCKDSSRVKMMHHTSVHQVLDKESQVASVLSTEKMVELVDPERSSEKPSRQKIEDNGKKIIPSSLSRSNVSTPTRSVDVNKVSTVTTPPLSSPPPPPPSSSFSSSSSLLTSKALNTSSEKHKNPSLVFSTSVEASSSSSSTTQKAQTPTQTLITHHEKEMTSDGRLLMNKQSIPSGTRTQSPITNNASVIPSHQQHTHTKGSSSPLSAAAPAPPSPASSLSSVSRQQQQQQHQQQQANSRLRKSSNTGSEASVQPSFSALNTSTMSTGSTASSILTTPRKVPLGSQPARPPSQPQNAREINSSPRGVSNTYSPTSHADISVALASASTLSTSHGLIQPQSQSQKRLSFSERSVSSMSGGYRTPTSTSNSNKIAGGGSVGGGTNSDAESVAASVPGNNSNSQHALLNHKLTLISSSRVSTGLDSNHLIQQPIQPLPTKISTSGGGSSTSPKSPVSSSQKSPSTLRQIVMQDALSELELTRHAFKDVSLLASTTTSESVLSVSRGGSSVFKTSTSSSQQHQQHHQQQQVDSSLIESSNIAFISTTNDNDHRQIGASSQLRYDASITPFSPRSVQDLLQDDNTQQEQQHLSREDSTSMASTGSIISATLLGNYSLSNSVQINERESTSQSSLQDLVHEKNKNESFEEYSKSSTSGKLNANVVEFTYTNTNHNSSLSLNELGEEENEGTTVIKQTLSKASKRRRQRSNAKKAWAALNHQLQLHQQTLAMNGLGGGVDGAWGASSETGVGYTLPTSVSALQQLLQTNPHYIAANNMASNNPLNSFAMSSASSSSSSHSLSAMGAAAEALSASSDSLTPFSISTQQQSIMTKSHSASSLASFSSTGSLSRRQRRAAARAAAAGLPYTTAYSPTSKQQQAGIASFLQAMQAMGIGGSTGQSGSSTSVGLPSLSSSGIQFNFNNGGGGGGVGGSSTSNPALSALFAEQMAAIGLDSSSLALLASSISSKTEGTGVGTSSSNSAEMNLNSALATAVSMFFAQQMQQQQQQQHSNNRL